MKLAHHTIPDKEGQCIEFKSFSGGISVKELSITMCAFANSDGGDIYIGLSDNARIIGCLIDTHMLDCIQNAAREGCSPAVSISLDEMSFVEGISVLKVTVQKSDRLHSVISGHTYIRIHSQDKRVFGDELLRIAEAKSRISFEEQFLDADMDVIDSNALNDYFNARRSMNVHRGDISHTNLLIKMGLAGYHEKIFKIKAGAFLLFGKPDESLLLQRDFTFVKYDADGHMYAFREDLSLPVIRLFDRLMELIQPYNVVKNELTALKRTQVYHYPLDAIREALLNAFAHRDYRISGLKNECRFYPDRLEIISAGKLPEMMTLDNLDKQHYSRNPKMMHALLTMGFTEELGQGISLMQHSLQKNGNPAPEFIENNDQFKVIFRRMRQHIIEIDYQHIFDEHFKHAHYITRQQAQALCNISATSAKNIIRKLIDDGYLIREGSGPSSRYRRSV